jgi:transposase
MPHAAYPGTRHSICERILKKAIVHRKNSLFYRTDNGAAVGDLYMALIATAKLARADPFDYLNQLQLHVPEVEANPSRWMPWNYRETMDGAAATS